MPNSSLLLLYEIFCWHTQTIQKLDHLSIKVPLTKGTGPDYIQAEIFRLKFYLALSHLNLTFKAWFRHQDAFSTRESDLKGRCLSVTHLSRNILSKG